MLATRKEARERGRGEEGKKGSRKLVALLETLKMPDTNILFMLHLVMTNLQDDFKSSYNMLEQFL